jgi:hypothetical protein
VAFKEKFPRMAPHINGITSWAYWLGWNPVIAVKMHLVVTYLDARLKPYGIVVPEILLGALLCYPDFCSLSPFCLGVPTSLGWRAISV